MSDYIEINEAGELVNFTPSPYVDGIGAYVFTVSGSQAVTGIVKVSGETHYLTEFGIHKL